MLDRFYEAKKAEIEALSRLAQSGQMPPVHAGQRPDFFAALTCHDSLPAIIAEYKRASPSRGTICENVSFEAAAREYAGAGAAALSILTEEVWFKGHLDFIARANKATREHCPLPLLRKDFILDPLQILATAATPASAVLLIVRFTPDVARLAMLREKAEHFGLECVVEVFDERDLAMARESGARIIQVNARDLDTFRVDRQGALQLAAKYPPRQHEKWIAASGISTGYQLREAAGAGYSAVLVGTSLMAGGQPGKALSRLMMEGQSC